MNLLLIGLAACAILQDGPARAKAAIEKVRAQKSYGTKFSAEIRAPNSDPMILNGEGLWVAGGVLFIHYKASGGEVRRIVRVGDQAWVYHELAEGWVDAREVGMNGAGRGVQNPDEVLGVLVNHLGNAALDGREDGRDVLRIRMSGADIEKVMKEQSQQGSFEWTESTAEAKALVGGDDLIARLTSSAELVSSDPNIKGQKVRYRADIEVTAYNAAFVMTFYVEDPKTKAKSDVPIDPRVMEAIEKRAGVPRELLDEIGRMREARIAKLVADLESKELTAREVADYELELFGRAALPALRSSRAPGAKALIERIEQKK